VALSTFSIPPIKSGWYVNIIATMSYTKNIKESETRAVPQTGHGNIKAMTKQ
jgi:hypothetical protein